MEPFLANVRALPEQTQKLLELRLLGNNQEKIILDAREAKLREEELLVSHSDLISTKNIRKLFESHKLRIPKEGIECPHYNIFVRLKRNSLGVTTGIPDDKFKETVLVVFHHWLFNLLMFKKYILDKEYFIMTVEEKGRFDDIPSLAEDAMLYYFKDETVEHWNLEKKNMLIYDNLMNMLAERRNLLRGDLAKLLEEEADEYDRYGKPPMRISKEYDETTKKTVKKNVIYRFIKKDAPPRCEHRKGKVDREIERLSKLSLKELYEETRKMSPRKRKDISYCKDFKIPTKGQYISSLNQIEFDEYCRSNNCSLRCIRDLKYRYRKE